MKSSLKIPLLSHLMHQKTFVQKESSIIEKKENFYRKVNLEI